MIHLSGLALNPTLAKERDRDRTLGLGLAERVPAAGAQKKIIDAIPRVVGILTAAAAATTTTTTMSDAADSETGPIRTATVR